MTNPFSRKIVSFFVLVLFLLSGVFASAMFAGAQTAPNQFYSLPASTSSPDYPATSLSFSSGSGPRAYPMYVLDSNPACCDSVPNTPALIREFYNSTTLLSEGITGKGVTIAIVDAYGDPSIQSELQTFDQTFGLPNPPSFNVMCIDGPCNYTLGIEYGWSVEIAIDVEWAHAMAPGANINLYIASNNANPLYDADLAAVDGASGTAPSGSGLGTLGVYHNNIISNSWGEPENDYTFSQSCILAPPCYTTGYPWIDQVFQKAAAKGITVFASSGDGGAFDQGDGFYQTLPYGGIESPADDPFVTSVGGTSAYLSTTSGSYGFVHLGSDLSGPLTPVTGITKGTYGYETAWDWLNDNAQRPGYSSATGGGYSSFFGQPAYQSGPGLPTNGFRANPDVAWDGDPHTGVVIYGNNGGVITYWQYGGTSLGAPSWAGVAALLDQKAGRSLGFLNPIFYSILNNPAEYSKAFHQITYGNNNGYAATPGWNPDTGMGTPNIGELANIISSMDPLSVTVKNNLQVPVQSLTPTPAYAYGQTVVLRASVNGGMKVPGPVLANITSQSGALLATNLPMKWDTTTGTYVGYYTVKPTDPAGEWGADVLAISNKKSGTGYNEFEVGDGLNIFSPYYTGVIGSNLYTVGETIPLAVQVENPANTVFVGTGHYKAILYLNYLGGQIQAVVPLTYNATAELWEGSYTIPKNVHQGSWVVAYSGVDGNGNQGVISYSWIIVGIFLWPYTDSYFYVHGQNLEIYAISSAVTGTMTGTLSYNGMVIRTVHMTLINATTGVWGGSTTLPSSGPSGFYTVTTHANDGVGDYGSNSEVLSIQSALSVTLTLSQKVISATNGKEDFTVSVTNPNGFPVTLGLVMARMNYTYANGTSALAIRVSLVYNAAQNAWLGSLNTSQLPGLATGKYTVEITAFDPFWNYGQASGEFYIH